MSIQTDIRTQELLAQFRAQRSLSRGEEKKTAAASSGTVSASRSVKQDLYLQAQASTSGMQAGQSQASEDRVEISLTANMTAETVNGILNDSVVEQINKALQEAGIDLKVEDVGDLNIDTSPEATARRIVDFSAGFLEAHRQNHADEADAVRVEGFMSLVRGAITDGFQKARDFLEGITKLSETVDRNIDRTFELTNQYLNDFHREQLDLIQRAEVDQAAARGEEQGIPTEEI